MLATASFFSTYHHLWAKGMSSTVPTVPSSQASKPKPSPPSVEEQCLKTFRTCWLIDKGWLVSFVASAVRSARDA